MKGILFILAGIALLSCCIQEEALSWTIEDVYDRPELYEGKTLVVDGIYMGWETGCAPTGPPVSRSDWQVRDETGCMYVTGMSPEPGLDPYADVGVEIKVTGTVRLSDAKIPYIEALKIEIIGGNETLKPPGNETGVGGIGDIFTEPDDEITPPGLPS